MLSERRSFTFPNDTFPYTSITSFWPSHHSPPHHYTTLSLRQFTHIHTILPHHYTSPLHLLLRNYSKWLIRLLTTPYLTYSHPYTSPTSPPNHPTLPPYTPRPLTITGSDHPIIRLRATATNVPGENDRSLTDYRPVNGSDPNGYFGLNGKTGEFFLSPNFLQFLLFPFSKP